MSLRRRRRSGGGFPGLQIVPEYSGGEVPDYSGGEVPDYLGGEEGNVVSGSGEEGSSSGRSDENGKVRSNVTRTPRTRLALCGNLPFCEKSADPLCYNTPITSCDQCSMAKGGVFVLILILLGLCIVIGNMLIAAVGYLRYRKRVMDKLDISKTSLAIADMLAGILLLVFIPYNFSWVIHLTIEEIIQELVASRNTPLANFGAVLVLFGFTSSVYHLIYIGMLRFYAIWKPINYRLLSKNSVFIGLAVVWIFAIGSATVPMWFPQQVTGSFLAPLMIFVPSSTAEEATNLTPLLLLTIFFLFLPYITMTIITISVGILSGVKLNQSKRQFEESGRNTSRNQSIDKMEIHLYITLIIMQVGFTITIVPLIVVAALFYTNSLVCDTFTLPYVISFYLSITNSLVNVIVYNIREKKFRSSVTELFSSFRSQLHSLTTSHVSSANTNTTSFSQNNQR